MRLKKIFLYLKENGKFYRIGKATSFANRGAKHGHNVAYCIANLSDKNIAEAIRLFDDSSISSYRLYFGKSNWINFYGIVSDVTIGCQSSISSISITSYGSVELFTDDIKMWK